MLLRAVADAAHALIHRLVLLGDSGDACVALHRGLGVAVDHVVVAGILDTAPASQPVTGVRKVAHAAEPGSAACALWRQVANGPRLAKQTTDAGPFNCAAGWCAE